MTDLGECGRALMFLELGSSLKAYNPPNQAKQDSHVAERTGAHSQGDIDQQAFAVERTIHDALELAFPAELVFRGERLVLEVEDRAISLLSLVGQPDDLTAEIEDRGN